MGRAHESISIARDGVNAELTSSSCSDRRARHAVALAKAGSPANCRGKEIALSSSRLPKHIGLRS